MQIPHLNTQIVPRHHVPSRIAELNITNRADDLPEEAFVVHLVVLGLLEEFRVLVAERRRSHVAQPDRAFTARVHEEIAVARMELCRCDDLRQLLHVRWLDVDDVERLVCDLQVPEVDA